MAAPIVGGTTPDLWLDGSVGTYSDAGITPAVDGGAIQQWNDQSGNNRHATQTGTSTLRPTLKTSYQNSLNCVKWSGTQWMNNAFTGEPKTIIVVYLSNIKAFNQTILGANTTAGINDGAYGLNPFNDPSTKMQCFWARSTAADSGSQQVWTTSAEGQLFYFDILGVRTDASTTAALWRHNFQIGSLANTGGAVRAFNAAYIGAGWYGGSVAPHFSGFIAELLMYSVQLSDTEYGNIIAYLENKWALTNSGPNVMAAFSGNSFAQGYGADQNLYLLEGSAGTFNSRPVSFFPNVSGEICRDFRLLRYANGKYYLTYANADQISAPTGMNLYTNTFSVAVSTNLKTFTKQNNVDCSAVAGSSPSTSHSGVWLPNPVQTLNGNIWNDPAISNRPHFMINYTNDGFATNHIAHMFPTSDDLSTWSTPVNISGTLPSSIGGTQVFYDPGSTLGAKYTMFYAYYDGTNHYIQVMQTNTDPPTDNTTSWGGWANVKTGNWASWGTANEHPWVQPKNDGTGGAYIYLDNLGLGTYYSENTTSAWLTGASWSAKAKVTVNGDATQAKFVPQGAMLLQLSYNPFLLRNNLNFGGQPR